MANVKQKNIQIPLSLFIEILEFMEYMDDAKLDIFFADMCDSILAQLRTKQDSIALREHYADIVLAKDEDRQHAALIHYTNEARL